MSCVNAAQNHLLLTCCHFMLQIHIKYCNTVTCIAVEGHRIEILFPTEISYVIETTVGGLCGHFAQQGSAEDDSSH